MHKLLPTESPCVQSRESHSAVTASLSHLEAQAGTPPATPNQAGRYNRLSSLFQGSVPFPDPKLIPILDILANVAFAFSLDVAKTKATKATTPLATDRIDFFLHGVNIFSPLLERSPSLRSSPGFSRGKLPLKMLTKSAAVAVLLFVIVHYLRRGPKIHRNGENLRCVLEGVLLTSLAISVLTVAL